MVQSRVAANAKVKKAFFWQEIPSREYFYFSVAINIAIILIIIALRGLLPPVAPLFYGRPEGAEQLVSSIWLLAAPLVSLAITAINIFLVSRIKDKFIRQVLVISAFLISILTTVTVLKIIFLVGLF